MVILLVVLLVVTVGEVMRPGGTGRLRCRDLRSMITVSVTVVGSGTATAAVVATGPATFVGVAG